MTDTQQQLEERFGEPREYLEEICSHRDTILLRREFARLQNFRYRADENYEISRQRILKYIGEHKTIWYKTGGADFGVEVSRAFLTDQYEYVGYMRIEPRGFKAERVTPYRSQMVFHILMGDVVFCKSKRTRTLSRGQYISLPNRSIYSIRSTSRDQPVYIVFRIIFKNSRFSSPDRSL